MVFMFIIMAPCGSVYAQAANPEGETFEILGDDMPRIFIEGDNQDHGESRVVFCMGKLEVSRLCRIEELMSIMDFIIYEQNPVRTRLRPAYGGIPIRLDINRGTGQGKLYLDYGWFTIHTIRVSIKPTALAGLYRLVFSGKGVYSYSEFVLEEYTGNIYCMPFHIPLEHIGPSYLWAVKAADPSQRYHSEEVTAGDIK